MKVFDICLSILHWNHSYGTLFLLSKRKLHCGQFRVCHNLHQRTGRRKILSVLKGTAAVVAGLPSKTFVDYNSSTPLKNETWKLVSQEAYSFYPSVHDPYLEVACIAGKFFFYVPCSYKLSAIVCWVFSSRDRTSLFVKRRQEWWPHYKSCLGAPVAQLVSARYLYKSCLAKLGDDRLICAQVWRQRTDPYPWPCSSLVR